ncbi:MAG: amidase [Chloroflexota bacterium]
MTLADDLAHRSATDLVALIRSRELSPTEVVEAAIARIEARNGDLNAFVFRGFDEARSRAAAATAAVLRGDPLGPLHGVPVAMKDLFDFKPGWPGSFGGVRPLAGTTVGFSCPWVERMEAAGAIVVGKTNSPVMGFRGTCDNPLFGPTRNPFDLSLNSGGSSGGSAAAVAAGLVPLAEGTDAGGSVRIPAAWCGVVGHKPSWGRVPVVIRPNGFGGTDPFVAEGPIGRTVADVALAMSALSGPDPRDPFSLPDRPDLLGALEVGDLRGLRIGYSPDLGAYPVDRRIAAVVADAVRRFEAAGATVDLVDVRLPADQRTLSDLWCRLITPLNIATFEDARARGIDLLRDHRDAFPAAYLRWIEDGYRRDVTAAARDQALRTQVYEEVERVLADVDLLVTPTVGAVQVPNADDGDTQGPTEVEGVAVDPLIGWCLTYVFNFTGHPAASVPAGLIDGRLPVGMQLVGRRGDDRGVLAAAAVFERIAPWSASYALTAKD